MADANQKTTIPKVPIATPMWDNQGSGADQVNLGNLTRTWIYFFERIWKGNGLTSSTTTSGAAGPFQRTLLLKDTTVGNDVADHVTVYGATTGQSSTCQRVLAVLRKAITADLTVRVNLWVAGVSSIVGTFTVPHATAINTPLHFTSFTTGTFPDLSVLSWDVTASDGSSDSAGIATFTVEWQ